MKNFGEKGALAYAGTTQIFGVGLPPIIPGMGKAANVKFGRYIHRIRPNKSPLKNLGKMGVGVSRDCPIF